MPGNTHHMPDGKADDTKLGTRQATSRSNHEHDVRRQLDLDIQPYVARMDNSRLLHNPGRRVQVDDGGDTRPEPRRRTGARRKLAKDSFSTAAYAGIRQANEGRTRHNEHGSDLQRSHREERCTGHTSDGNPSSARA